MTQPTARVSIRCDRHPERIAVRYRASDKSRACAECEGRRKDQQP